MFIVGVDVGGTFTDVTAVDTDSGEVRIGKVPSQPLDERRPSSAGLAGAPASSRSVRRLVHWHHVGTTRSSSAGRAGCVAHDAGSGT